MRSQHRVACTQCSVCQGKACSNGETVSEVLNTMCAHFVSWDKYSHGTAVPDVHAHLSAAPTT